TRGRRCSGFSSGSVLTPAFFFASCSACSNFSPSMPLTVLPNIWMKRRRASSANRSSFVNAAMPLAVSSLRPRLRTVSIIPATEKVAHLRGAFGELIHPLMGSGHGGVIFPCLMDDLGQATEDQVILAWLQAEIESPDFQAYLVGNPPNPANLSAALKAARSPDLRDEDQNGLRREIITSVYGFGHGAGSFQG